MKALILALVLKLPTVLPDRTNPELPIVRERLAQGVTEACAITPFPSGESECAAYVITTGRFESNYAINVQAGACLPYQCDPFKLRNGRIVHRARSWWQGWRNDTPIERWDAIEGLDQEAISQAAILAAERLRSARFRCGPEPGSVFAGYGGRGCKGRVRHHDERIATFEKIRAKLQQPSLCSKGCDIPKEAPQIGRTPGRKPRERLGGHVQ